MYSFVSRGTRLVVYRSSALFQLINLSTLLSDTVICSILVAVNTITTPKLSKYEIIQYYY